jgi:phosphoglycolate phosphatase
VSHLIALDLDGTLEDSRVDMVNAVHRVRAALGLGAWTDDAVRPHVSRGMGHLYRTCFAEYLEADDGPRRLTEVRAAYEADYRAHIADTTALYDGIAEALPRLAGLAPLAVVTNKPEALSEALLTALGVRRWFAVVVGGDSCAEEKPSAVPLQHAAQAVGATGRVVLIGDSAGDVRCARAAGAASVWCAWGYHAEPGPDAPDARADAPADLPRVVRGLLG